MNICLDYVEHGLALVPIPVGEKGPKTKGWNDHENVITDPQKALLLLGNVGLAHLYCEPFATATLDIDDYLLAEKFLAKWGIDLKELLDAEDAVQIVSSKNNRAKLLYRLPYGVDLMHTRQVPDLETKNMILEFRCASSNGKTVQDLIPPSIHPETGKEYRWAGNGSWRDIPTIPDSLLKLWQELNKMPANPKVDISSLSKSQDLQSNNDAELSPTDKQNLRSALFYLRSDERELWIKVGLALKNLDEFGRGLWLEWSMTSKKYEPLDAANTWDSFKPKSIDYKFVFAEAQRQGWFNPAKRIDLVNTLTSTSHTSWHQPQKLPEELLPVTFLNPEWLPEAIRAGCKDIAERLNCPLDYVAVPAIVGAGTVLGNTIGILPKEHDESWVVHAGFWGGIVGSPGSMKSPALISSLKPVHHLEELAVSQYKKDCIQYQIDKANFDKALNAFKNSKSTNFPIEPNKPIKARLIVNDVTYQALGEILAHNPRGVLALADELSGLLQSLDTPGQEAARGFYLSGWGGQGNYTFDRITREPIILTRYQLAVFGGFQPDRIKAYVRFAQSGSSKNDGLLQRFQLLVWPDLPEKFELIDRPANKEALAQMNQAIVSLRHIKTIPINGSTLTHSGLQLIHFDTHAQRLFNEWYQKNENMLRSGKLDSSEQGHFAKYRSLIPGLALLFHLLNGHQAPVCGT